MLPFHFNLYKSLQKHDWPKSWMVLSKKLAKHIQQAANRFQTVTYQFPFIAKLLILGKTSMKKNVFLSGIAERRIGKAMIRLRSKKATIWQYYIKAENCSSKINLIYGESDCLLKLLLILFHLPLLSLQLLHKASQVGNFILNLDISFSPAVILCKCEPSPTSFYSSSSQPSSPSLAGR